MVMDITSYVPKDDTAQVWVNDRKTAAQEHDEDGRVRITDAVDGRLRLYAEDEHGGRMEFFDVNWNVVGTGRYTVIPKDERMKEWEKACAENKGHWPNGDVRPPRIYRGSCEVSGKSYWVDAYPTKSRNGNEYNNVRFRLKDQQAPSPSQTPATPAPAMAEQPVAVASAPSASAFGGQDDCPF